MGLAAYRGCLHCVVAAKHALRNFAAVIYGGKKRAKGVCLLPSM